MQLDYTPISEDSPFFDFCRRQSAGIYDIILKLEENDEFTDSIDDYSFLDAFDFFDNHNCRIVIMVFMDMIQCCQLMDIDDEVPLLASISFRMLFSKLYWDDETYDLFCMDSKSELFSANNAFKILSRDLPFNAKESERPFDFSLSYCMERFGFSKESLQAYKLQLYYFTVLLAPKDVRTVSQSYFLNSFENNMAEYCYDYDDTCADCNGTEEVEEEIDDEEAVLPLESLSRLIGLDRVKAEVSKLADFVKIQQLRKEKGLKITPISYHCVFTGNHWHGQNHSGKNIGFDL